MKTSPHTPVKLAWGALALVVLLATLLLYTRPDFMLAVNQLVWACFGLAP